MMNKRWAFVFVEMGASFIYAVGHRWWSTTEHSKFLNLKFYIGLFKIKRAAVKIDNNDEPPNQLLLYPNLFQSNNICFIETCSIHVLRYNSDRCMFLFALMLPKIAIFILSIRLIVHTIFTCLTFLQIGKV